MGNVISFKKEFGLILVGAVIFTASFLWKDFLSDVEDMYFPKTKGLIGRLFFVLITTIVLVTMAVHLKDFFGISSGSKSIQFDDSPIEDNNNDYNIMDDMTGTDTDT